MVVKANDVYFTASSESDKPGKIKRAASVSSTSDDDIETARKFRQNALKAQGKSNGCFEVIIYP